MNTVKTLAVGEGRKKTLDNALARAIEMATPQSLIHIKHNISLQQYKYFLILFDWMSSEMEKGIPPSETSFYEIPMSELADRIGYTPNKKELWNDFVKLKNETVAVNYLMKDGGAITYGAGYISEWGISNSYIKFKFPTFFVQVAQKFKEQRRLFLQLHWEIFNSFTGKYEAILYKLCKDYEKSGGKRTPEFSVEGFREYIGLKEKEYSQFEELSKFCIKNPVKKINELALSDITVVAQYNTKGRKVIGIYFEVESKHQQSLPIGNDYPDNPFMFARVPIPMAVQTQYLKNHTIEQAKLCIQAANEWIDAKIKSGDTVVHGRAYRSALEGNWQPNKPDIENQIKQLESKKEEQLKSLTEKEKEKETKEAASRQWVESTLAKFDALPEERRAELRKTYGAGLADITRKSFEKQAERAPMHRYKFAEFVEQQINK